MTESIRSRYLQVLEKVERACADSGRSSSDVTLVVVTKGQPASKIVEVVNAGASNLGENYPEETHAKLVELGDKVKPIWHMIGHLQSRKIKLMYPYFDMIHSLDSLELAEKLNRYYGTINDVCNVLVEVNLAGEESKYGFNCQSSKQIMFFEDSFEKLLQFSQLKIQGLMTMPPYVSQGEQNETYFRSCKELLLRIEDKFNLLTFNQLSMGTSSDFETAIKCGATFIRIGEAIMGQRTYS